MRRDERVRRQRLDAALASMDAAERRALADLAVVGFRFGSIGAAKLHRDRLAAIDRYVSDSDVDRLSDVFLRGRGR